MQGKVVLVIVLLLIASIAHAGTWTEDFASGLKEWEIYQFQKGAEKWFTEDRVAVGEIFKVGFMSLLLITQSDNWTNYAINCKVKFNKIGEEVQQLPEVGLVLYHHPKEDTRYVFSLRSNGSGSFSKRNNGLGEVVVFETKRYPSGVWIVLRAEVQGNALIFSINNDVFSGNDKSPLSIGGAGLMVTNAKAMFDDIVITGDSIPNRKTSVLSVDNKHKLPQTWGSLKKLY